MAADGVKNIDMAPFAVFVCGTMLCCVCRYSFTGSLAQFMPLVRWKGSICVSSITFSIPTPLVVSTDRDLY